MGGGGGENDDEVFNFYTYLLVSNSIKSTFKNIYLIITKIYLA